MAAPTRTTKSIENYTGEGPKWRLEHASNGLAGCQQAACRRAGTKIEKGELRIGTHTFFERENRWYMAWRHWGCATKFQIQGLKGVTKDDPIKAAGYDRLSSEAQEQVRLAFENGDVVDKLFKGVSMELAKVPKRYGGEITNATGYKVDVATRGTAACRNSDCPEGATKIAKGELRLGLSMPFDGDHESWQYKHWKCVSKYDLEAIQTHHNADDFYGIDALPEDYQAVVIETLEKGEVVAPPKPTPVPAKKPKKSKKKSADDDSDAGAPGPEPKTIVKAEEQNSGEQRSEIWMPTLGRESQVKTEESNSESGALKAEPERKSEVKTKENSGEAGVLEPERTNQVKTEEVNSEAEAPKPKQKIKGKRKKKDGDANNDAEDAEKQKPKSKTKPKPKGKGKKRSSEELDASSEPEYVPRKTRSRAAPMEEVASI